ncbi:hypothetical protein BOX15_Mlig013537g3, partial [Macrostomum lignano]
AEIVPLNVGPPHPCQLEGVKQTASGCIIKEVTFIGVGRVDIDEIRFRNCHTGFISIRVRYAQQPQHPPPPPSASSGGRRSAAAAAAAASPGEWRTCLHRRRLMPDPHSELGGLAQFRFGQPDWQAPVTGVAAVRLVLMQPSPVWREFGIEALQIVRRHAGARAAPPSPLQPTRWPESAAPRTTSEPAVAAVAAASPDFPACRDASPSLRPRRPTCGIACCPRRRRRRLPMNLAMLTTSVCCTLPPDTAGGHLCRRIDNSLSPLNAFTELLCVM